MGVGGLFGLFILIVDIWAIVKTVGSQASAPMKLFWIILVLVLPVLGLLLWLLAGPRKPNV